MIPRPLQGAFYILLYPFWALYARIIHWFAPRVPL